MSICVYCEIDEETLQPKNQESLRRIDSLELDKILRSEDSVFDIGCNSGLLSIIAATKFQCDVLSVDIQQPIINRLENLVRRHGISSIKPILGDIFAIDFRRKFDHVFFLQVLHWACYQGHSVDNVIDRLSQLTKRSLTIEFPWDVNEPAIKNQTNLTDEIYSSKAIFRALCREFEKVEVMGFQDYFNDPLSNRVLVRCFR